MSFSRLEFTKTWLDPDAFPAYEPDEGKVRADLQCLHDETKDALNRLIDALNGTSAAEALPIAPVAGLEADTVQAAIEQVFAAVTDAAAAKIVDRSVTKEKLSEELLARIFGGSVRISADAPTVYDDPDHGCPVGQLWLRPALEPLDLADGVWEAKAGEQAEGLTFNSAEDDRIKAVFTSEIVGRPGDRVLLRLELTASDELGEMSIVINGDTDISMEEDGIYETSLDSTGSLQLEIEGNVPDGRAAWFRVDCLCVMDVDALERRYPLGKTYGEWAQSLGDFTGTIPLAVWIQTSKGVWEQVVFDALPVSHGGTGLSHAVPGGLLYGGEEDRLTMLTPVEGGILQYQGGKPTLVEPDALAEGCGYLRVRSGSYEGTGGNADRTLELPVTPLMLLIWPADGSCDTVCLANGGRASGTYTFYDGVSVSYKAWVRLDGKTLRFSNERYGNKAGKMLSQHMNAEGVGYQWLAVH